MANPQLVTYIQSQLSAGASKEAIRSALLGAGWPESDVNDAMGNGSPAPSMASAAPSVSAGTVKQESDVKPAASAVSAVSPVSSPSAVIHKDQIGKQNNNSFSAPVSSASASANPAASFKVDEVVFNPEISSASPSVTAGSPSGTASFKAVSVSGHHTSRVWVIAAIVFIATTLAASALAAFFNMEKNDLDSKVHTLTAQTERMASQVSMESANRKADSTKTDSLQNQLNDLEQQLSIFVPPVGSATSGDLPVTVTGRVATDTVGVFTITTSRGIVLNIKNSKDSKVSEVLKPLIGTVVTVDGVHTLGSKDVSFIGLVSSGQPSVAPAQPASVPPSPTQPSAHPDTTSSMPTATGTQSSAPVMGSGSTTSTASAPVKPASTSTVPSPTSTVQAK